MTLDRKTHLTNLLIHTTSLTTAKSKEIVDEIYNLGTLHGLEIAEREIYLDPEQELEDIRYRIHQAKSKLNI